MGLAVSYTPVPWNESDDAILRQLWDEGVTLSEIASKLGRTYDSVATRRYGLKLPARHKMSWEQHHSDELRKLIAEGKSITFIAKHMRRDKNYISQRVSELGLVAKTMCRSAHVNQNKIKRKKYRPLFRGVKFNMPDLPKEVDGAVSIEDADFRTCRYIVAWPDKITVESEMFCSGRAIPGTSWCREHHKVVFYGGSCGGNG